VPEVGWATSVSKTNQGRFARPVFADQAHDRASRDLEVHMVKNRLVAIDLGEVVRFNDIFHMETI
jgi:hypothetical protein